MRSSSFYVLSAAVAFALVCAIATADVQTAPRPAPAPQTTSSSPQKAAVKTPSAEYVGQDTCLACHDDRAKGLSGTVHSKAAHPRSPAAAQGCESCHGPGSRHI